MPKSNAEAWELFFRLIVWTPQIIWGLIAGYLLVTIWRHVQRGRRWFLGLPYLMIIGRLIYQMPVAGIPPFPPAGGYLTPDYQYFWDSTAPSSWALVGLIVIHLLLFAQQQAQEPQPPTA